jgi:hypothetical protein
MSSQGGGGGGIIDHEAVTLLSNSAVSAMLPPLVRATIRTVVAKPTTIWDADDRWYIGQALGWLICNVK